jgi:methanogenic corrinoid protein MtbC1
MSDNEFLNASREVVFKSAIDDQAINRLKLSMFQFDKILFNSTYDELLQKKTFREVFKDIFIPFLHHIGLLWQTDTLIPAHENFISTLIAQKIQLQTEKIQHGISKSSKTYVLFLPENEIHELGLLYLNYELILRGNFTIYLGQSLPLDNLDWFFKNSSEICFITSMTVMPYDHKIEEYFREIDLILKDTPHQLIAIGQKVNLVNIEKLQSKINLYNSVSDLLNKL